MKKIATKIFSIILILSMLIPLTVLPSAALEEYDDITELGGDYYIICDTDKDMLSYMPGDQVIFTVKVFGRKKQITVPYLLYTVERDDGNKNSGEVYPDAEGNYIISDYTMDIPGYVRLLIDFPDSSGNPNKEARKENQRSAFEGGVLVDVENIKTLNEEPSDFKDFWDESLAILDDYAPDPVELVLVDEKSNYNIYEVYINCYGDPDDLKSGDTFAAGYLNVPKKKELGSLPLQMNFQGYGEKGAGKYPSDSTIVLNMCAHSFRLGLDEYDSSLFNLETDETQYGWSQTRNQDKENVYFRNMILRNVQAARFLMKYFGDQAGVADTNIGNIDISSWKGLWNGKDLKVSGGSQGGFQSVSLAALCPEVSQLTASIPWFGNVAAGTYTEPTSGMLGSTFIPKYASGLDYYDTAFFASYVTCDTAITGGMGDMTCSPTNLMAMYNNAKRGKNINISITLKQGMTHMFKPDPEMVSSTISVYKSEITDWSLENGVLTISGNGTVSSDFPAVREWNAKLGDDLKEINILGNVTALGANVFELKNGVNIYIKTSEPVLIDPNAFGSGKDAVIYYSAASKAGEFAESAGLISHSMGVPDASGAFFYTVDGDTLKIYSIDENIELTTTSGDIALGNFVNNNADIIKNAEIHGKFASVGNMQPVFSKLANAVSLKIDSRSTVLSGEKNFMGMSSLVSLGHYDFINDKSTTFTEGVVDLTGFDSYISEKDRSAVPPMILSNCTAVKHVIMPDGLMCGDTDAAGYLSERVFGGCTALETVEFPANVTVSSFEFGVFNKCGALKKVLIKGHVADNFSCVFNMGKVLSFEGVPETAVFEVSSKLDQNNLKASFEKGTLGFEVYVNGGDQSVSASDNADNTVLIAVIASAAAVMAAVVIIAVVLKKKKSDK